MRVILSRPFLSVSSAGSPSSENSSLLPILWGVGGAGVDLFEDLLPGAAKKSFSKEALAHGSEDNILVEAFRFGGMASVV